MKFFDHTIYAPNKTPKFEKTSVSSVPSVVDTYQYSYRVNIYSGSESAWTLEKQTTFTYDGWNLIEEVEASVYDSNNSVFTQFRTSNYTWGLDLSQTLQRAGGVGGLLTMEKGVDKYNYTYDANGNVSELIDTAGVVVAHYEYSPFGKLTKEILNSQFVINNSFKFSTKYLDNETGLNYYGLRYYNPTTGRWINRDPIRELGGTNLHRFARNNPISYIDVLGLSANGGWHPPMVHPTPFIGPILSDKQPYGKQNTSIIRISHGLTHREHESKPSNIHDYTQRDFPYMTSNNISIVYLGCGMDNLNGQVRCNFRDAAITIPDVGGSLLRKKKDHMTYNKLVGKWNKHASNKWPVSSEKFLEIDEDELRNAWPGALKAAEKDAISKCTGCVDKVYLSIEGQDSFKPSGLDGKKWIDNPEFNKFDPKSDSGLVVPEAWATFIGKTKEYDCKTKTWGDFK